MPATPVLAVFGHFRVAAVLVKNKFGLTNIDYGIPVCMAQ